MSAFLDGLGAIAKKATEWIPSKRESNQNKIEKLIDENARLANEEPLSAQTASRISNNLQLIKRLRSQTDRIA